ncbi:MAG: hypothetical protein EP329_07450 [Deltaproteobacteria bacterium]|nr:MAG: hypothetical protein EP329_07450 [Deltaproteobacteria bacterium]
MIRRAMTLALATAVLVLGACDDSSGTAEADTVETDTLASDTLTEADTTEAVDTTTVEEDTAAADTAEAYDYPPGPYGTRYLDIIDPELGFYDPWADSYTYVHQFYGDPNVKVLLISSAAGWCTACMLEAWELVDTYDTYHDKGFEILYTLYEDAQSRPLWDDVHRRESDMALMNDWRDNAGVYIGKPRRVIDYPLFVDVGFQLNPYYTENATPLTLLVRTSDMRIVYSAVGYSAGSISDNVKTVLFAQ